MSVRLQKNSEKRTFFCDFADSLGAQIVFVCVSRSLLGSSLRCRVDLLKHLCLAPARAAARPDPPAMALSIPAWLEIPPAQALCKVRGLVLEAMVVAKTCEDAQTLESLGAVSDLLGDFVSTLVDRDKYETALGRHLGTLIVTVKEKDALCAMVEINKGQQNAIRGKDKKEYEELGDVFTMLEEMIEFHHTCKTKGKGKRGTPDAAVSASCTKYARCA